ncbi:hypothetical protein [Zophobihabitans entericus]|uniref:Beta-1,3-glucanase N-terminal domain-containing protein n=1 Tax=Zophobihabitans entericus TaxID=1635327 RepID=A0A6G9I8D4_9GAMM|nr:hypothetical protein [Zophobihabitans entericus]QIQ20471.1 hypothetical protein IPMB12_01510 [Zophobihabitans entericus]
MSIIFNKKHSFKPMLFGMNKLISFKAKKLVHGPLLLVTGLCLLPSVASALSATTANSIVGNAPRINFAHETDIINGADAPFFNMQYKSTLIDTRSNPQYWFDLALKKEDPTAMTPASFLNDVSNVVSTYVSLSPVDSDGDRNFVFSVENTKGTIYNYNGGSLIPLTEEQMNLRFSQLIAANIQTYLKLESVVKLTTQYGTPNVRYYPDASIGVPQTPMRRVLLNFSNLGVLGATGALVINSSGAGNDANWGSTSGFIPTTDLSKSFPTTGFNGAFMKLNITGFNALNPDLNWQVIKTPSSSNINATVSVQDSKTVIVSFTGPSSGDTNGLGPVPFNGPVTFEVKDSLNALSYKFQITKWFIPKSFGVATPIATALNYCDTMSGYRSVTRAELTNTAHANPITYPAYDPITGANNGTNPIPDSVAAGHAIGPLFSEWGYPSSYGGDKYYPASDFAGKVYEGYLTNERYSDAFYYRVNYSGSIDRGSSIPTTTVKNIVCVSQ